MLLMMGSADALPSAPVEKTKFIEDMSDAQVAKAVCRCTFFLNFSQFCAIMNIKPCISYRF